MQAAKLYKLWFVLDSLRNEAIWRLLVITRRGHPLSIWDHWISCASRTLSVFESLHRTTGDYSRNETLKSFAAWLMVVIQAHQVSNGILPAAVWISYASTDGVSKYVAMFVTISSFVALGFEHSVANMFIIPYVSAGFIYWLSI